MSGYFTLDSLRSIVGLTSSGQMLYPRAAGWDNRVFGNALLSRRCPGSSGQCLPSRMSARAAFAPSGP